MALVRTLTKGLRKTPRQGGNPMDVDGPTVTISGYPTDPTDDPTPTFTFSANESGCTFEYKVNAGSYAACTSPLTLGAQADGSYVIYIRATDGQGNVGSAATYSWTLATAYAGTLPSTVAALNGWSLASPWTILYNFDSATVSPSALASAAPGSVTHGLIKWGSDATATKTADGQSGYADQSGYKVNTSQDFFIQYASAAWKFSATVPTCYLLTFKFDATPTSGTTFFGGSDGATGGWYLEAHATSGIRAAIGNGTSGFVGTSYVGGTSFYDGEYHTVMLVVDDAAGKAKIYSEFANTESTGLTIASGDAICTIGPNAAGATWTTAVTYLIAARGEHPLLYTNAQSLFDEYEDARLNNVNQTAIAGLPTSLAELNSASGLTFTHAWNMSSVSSNPPITGASGASLAPYTGTLVVGGAGTAPTLLTAPQGRTSFTSQAGVLLDSANDNMHGSDLWTGLDMTAFIVVKSTDASGSSIAAKTDYTAAKAGWVVTLSGGSLTLTCYSSFSTSISRGYTPPSGYATNYNLLSFRVPGASGQYSRVKMGGSAGSSSSSTYGTPGTESSAIAVLGANKDQATRNTSILFVARLAGQTADAALDAAHDAFRWRYGL